MARNVALFIAAAAGIAALVYAQQSRAATGEGSDEPLPEVDFNNSEGDAVNWKTNEYPKYASAIRDAEVRFDIPSDLYARLLFQESHYRPDIISGAKRSPVGAIGISQFMPDTGEDYGLVTFDAPRGTAGRQIVTDRRTDPFASIAAGARYLAALHRMFGDWNSALMAYNWGPGNVAKYNRGEVVTVPLETSTYVAQITADVPV